MTLSLTPRVEREKDRKGCGKEIQKQRNGQITTSFQTCVRIHAFTNTSTPPRTNKEKNQPDTNKKSISTRAQINNIILSIKLIVSC